MVLPVNLHVEYGRKLFNPLDPMVVLGVIFLAALLIAMVRNKKNKTMMFGLGWFTVSMIPVSNIYPLNAYMAEHWLYLPSVGIFLILAWGAGILIQRGGLARIMALSAVALFTVIWVVMTHNQNKNWADPVSFYERAIKYSPDSVKMYNDLGRLYGTDNKDAEKAEKVLKKAIMSDPKYPLSYNNLGLLYYNNGKKEEGIALYRKALKLSPFYTDALNNLAMAYNEKGMYPEAIRLYQKALQTNPNYDLLYSNLGATYINMGRNNEAEYVLGIAIKLNPRLADAYFNLAILYARTGRAAQAMNVYNKAVELKPAFGSPEFRKKIEDSIRNT
jgi:tetratricopeptide (TPR) repeat protein